MGSYFNFLIRKTVPKKKKEIILEKIKEKPALKQSPSSGNPVTMLTFFGTGIITMVVAMTVFPAITGSLNTNSIGGGQVSTMIGPILNFAPLMVVGVIVLGVLLTAIKMLDV